MAADPRRPRPGQEGEAPSPVDPLREGIERQQQAREAARLEAEKIAAEREADDNGEA